MLAGKTIAVNAVSNTASYAVGYIGEKADLPSAVTIALSLCSGITVSKVAGKYIFKNAAGTVIKKTTKANAAKEIKIEANAAKGAGETFSPINPGTLSDEVASTFRSSTYTKRVLTEDTVFYRVYGGDAEIAGNYMSRTPQMGGLQSQLDLALVPEWGNTATYVTKVTVPKGTVIYEGFAAPQTINGGAGMLMGGGSQIYIPEARFNPTWFGN